MTASVLRPNHSRASSKCSRKLSRIVTLRRRFGIGLSLVKGLRALHGGEIDAHSEGPGRGSEFIVRLPLTSPATVESRARELDAPIDPRAARRIMVADDNKDAADTLGMLLELAGHEVRVVYSGRAAFMLAQTFRPDVAFIDIGMPDLSGYGSRE